MVQSNKNNLPVFQINHRKLFNNTSHENSVNIGGFKPESSNSNSKPSSNCSSAHCLVQPVRDGLRVGSVILKSVKVYYHNSIVYTP